MTDILKVAGITGWVALVVATVVWLMQRAIEAKIARSQETLASDLRKAERWLTSWLNAGAAVDVDLRSKRDDAYRALWASGETLSRFPPNERLRYAGVDPV